MRREGGAGLTGVLEVLSGSHGARFPPFFPLVPYRVHDLLFAGTPQMRHEVAVAPL